MVSVETVAGRIVLDMRRTILKALTGALFAAGLGIAGQAAAGERSWSASVADQFKASGLKPAVGRSYLQPVRLTQQTIALDHSSAALVHGAAAEALGLGSDLILDPSARQPQQIAAPLMFLGSREPGPAMLHELQGKIVVMTERDGAAMTPASWSTLQHSGALGFITLTGGAPAAPAADGFVGEDAPVRLVASAGPGAAARLFARSGRDYAEIAALAEAGRSLPSFPLNLTLKASLSIRSRSTGSANVIGVAVGSDPLLAREYVVISAAAGDAAPVLDAARRFHDAGMRPKRSVVFAVFAPEQQGAPGAQAFAARPPVAREDIVASLGASVGPQGAAASVAIEGAEETSLGGVARDLASGARLTLAGAALPSPRTGADAYRFLEAGVPALRLTFGAAAEQPEAAYLLAVALQVADNDAHPAWMRGSRFAPRMPQAQEMLTAPVDMPLGRRPQRSVDGYAWLAVPKVRVGG